MFAHVVQDSVGQLVPEVFLYLVGIELLACHVAELPKLDAAVVVVPEAEKDEALAFIVECMSTPPDWCKDLPVACEAKFATSYGEC